ncbi:restriction endonuclease [Sulfobacillus thermosulfidooxidans]|uniref:restriction endonuclease n=1 Tax=Sulfobacillus thermosulfidooxidans TaxID=28034 RepID=UPI0006B5C255|nr:restriction endonuclease [Sulfobacillus thermosulfidooxidans]
MRNDAVMARGLVRNLGYFEEMQRLRRQLLDQYWPKIEPVVTRLLEKQRTPLTQVQIEAVSALIAETFHLAKVDRIYLDMLIKRLEARVLGYGPASDRGEDIGRYITISDCELMTPLQFCRVIRHLFAKFGYQGACVKDTWLELHHSSDPSQRILAYLEVKNRIVHEADMHELISLKKQQSVERALYITVGTYGSEIWELATHQGIELWDGHQLAALLDRVRLPAGAMLD